MTLKFACAEVGITDCRKAVSAETAEGLLELVAAHARDAHGVELNDTLIGFALTKVTDV